MENINKSISALIKYNDMYVLRDKRTGQALNTSYTIDGLKWTTNATGKLIFFKNARLVRNNNFITFEGNLEMSDKVYVEKFEPKDHRQVKLQVAEYTWVAKAYRQCYLVL